ncbi:hypothetical protein HZB02_06580 [Candidatus Woesearchaeota archaeon]|nr:hypothetical protein [Candidatus Woesearchaeota archaeon]
MEGKRTGSGEGRQLTGAAADGIVAAILDRMHNSRLLKAYMRETDGCDFSCESHGFAVKGVISKSGIHDLTSNGRVEVSYWCGIPPKYGRSSIGIQRHEDYSHMPKSKIPVQDFIVMKTKDGMVYYTDGKELYTNIIYETNQFFPTYVNTKSTIIERMYLRDKEPTCHEADGYHLTNEQPAYTNPMASVRKWDLLKHKILNWRGKDILKTYDYGRIYYETQYLERPARVKPRRSAHVRTYDFDLYPALQCFMEHAGFYGVTDSSRQSFRW